MEGQSCCHHIGRQKSHPQGQGPGSLVLLLVIFLFLLSFSCSFFNLAFPPEPNRSESVFISLRIDLFLTVASWLETFSHRVTGLKKGPDLTLLIREEVGNLLFLRDPSLRSAGHSETRLPIPRDGLQSPKNSRALTHWSHIPPHGWYPPQYWWKSYFLYSLISICTFGSPEQATQSSVISIISISCLR